MSMKVYLNFRRFCDKNAPSQFYDIVISGGGLIGQTMACALAKNPMFNSSKILLVESSKQKNYECNGQYSNRVSSIAPKSKKMLEKLGIWKHIKKCQPVKNMKVWGYLSNDYITFDHEVDNPAYIVENDEVIKGAILENMNAPNIKILYESKIKEVLLTSDGKSKNKIQLSDNSWYETGLLIGADGSNSFIRNVMGSEYINWNYKQFGIVATLTLSERDENFTSWQRFLPDGPIAILPLTRNLSSLVWSVTEKKAKNLLQLSEEVFVNALNEALHLEPQKNELVNAINDASKSLLGVLNFKYHPLPIMPPHVASVLKKSIAAFPLGFGHSSEYFKNGVALIGDSAHRVHPLAGQGVNIGFRDIQLLEDKLSQGLYDGRELGHPIDLKHYETEAQRQNIPLMAAIDALHWLYTSNNNAIKAIGNVCFHFTESVPLLKNIMIKIAA